MQDMFTPSDSKTHKLDNIITILSKSPDYKYETYNNIILNIDSNKRYDHYYIINTDMTFYDEHNNYYNDYNKYMPAIGIAIDRVLADTTIMSRIQSGEAMLLFDFSVEDCPISIDDSTIYGKINKHFSKINTHNNVIYWTMNESVYDKIDKKDCNVGIECVSLSTLRYVRFNYNNYKKLIYSNKNELERKSALYLNRRPRKHRILLLAECIRRNIDVDDMYISFIGNSLSDSDKKKDIKSIKSTLDNYYANGNAHSTHIGNSISPYLFKNIYPHLGKNIEIRTNKSGKIRLGGKVDGDVITRVTDMLSHRVKSKFEIITEYTYTDTDISISEKLSLAMLSKIPFVVLGDRHYLRHLKKLGFKTFDLFWSEEYDNKNEVDRVSAVASTINDVISFFDCNTDEYNNTIYSKEMNEILEHNYIHYKDIYAPTIVDRILKTLSINEKDTDMTNNKEENITQYAVTLSKLMSTHFDNFKQNYPEIAECKELMGFHGDGLEQAMSKSFWRNNIRMLEAMGLSINGLLSKPNPAILDLGTQFGLFPHFLNSIGLVDVSYTNSVEEAGPDIGDLQLVWDKLESSNAEGTQMPIPLHIRQQEHFTLPKKYDLIICTTTNVLWQTDKVLRFHNDRLDFGYYVTDKDDKSHTFFAPYDVSDLRFFIENIKEYLNDGGIALIQPYPFPYHVDEFKEELELLKAYQLPEDGYVGPNDKTEVDVFATKHNRWMSEKVDDGWRYGLKFNEENKTDPRLLPYEELIDNDELLDYFIIRK